MVTSISQTMRLPSDPDSLSLSILDSLTTHDQSESALQAGLGPKQLQYSISLKTYVKIINKRLDDSLLCKVLKPTNEDDNDDDEEEEEDDAKEITVHSDDLTSFIQVFINIQGEEKYSKFYVHICDKVSASLEDLVDAAFDGKPHQYSVLSRGREVDNETTFASKFVQMNDKFLFVNKGKNTVNPLEWRRS